MEVQYKELYFSLSKFRLGYQPNPIIIKYFGICFVQTRSFTYKNSIQLLKSGHWHCHSTIPTSIPYSSIPIMFYMAKGACLGSGISFSSHVSLVSSLEELLTFSFQRLQVNYFGECPLIWVCSIFSIIHFMHLWGVIQKWCFFLSLHPIRWKEDYLKLEGKLYSRCGELSLLATSWSRCRSLKSMCLCVFLLDQVQLHVVFCLHWCFFLIKPQISKCDIYSILKLFLCISITLEQIYIFTASIIVKLVIRGVWINLLLLCLDGLTFFFFPLW